MEVNVSKPSLSIKSCVKIRKNGTREFDDTKNCSAAKIAEAVQCLRDKAFDGWDAHVDPWAEHLSHFQTCLFAQLVHPEAALNVEQMIVLHSILVKKQIETEMQKIVAVYAKKYNEDYLKSQSDVELKKF